MPRPIASTMRSPIRSVRKPHGSRVTSVPSQWLESDGADLGEAQSELIPDRRRDRRQADSDRSEAALRERPRGQHRPAVARARYRPKGLIGREPVFTVTLFVSR